MYETAADGVQGGIEFFDMGEPRAIGIRINGRLTGDAMARFIERVEEVTERGDKALIYVDMVNYDGWEFAVAKEKMENMRTLWDGIERLAYVLDKDWMSRMIGLVDAVTPMNLRAFGPDQEDQARDWLLSGD